jgi:hypothetical protein
MQRISALGVRLPRDSTRVKRMRRILYVHCHALYASCKLDDCAYAVLARQRRHQVQRCCLGDRMRGPNVSEPARDDKGHVHNVSPRGGIKPGTDQRYPRHRTIDMPRGLLNISHIQLCDLFVRILGDVRIGAARSMGRSGVRLPRSLQVR